MSPLSNTSATNIVAVALLAVEQGASTGAKRGLCQDPIGELRHIEIQDLPERLVQSAL